MSWGRDVQPLPWSLADARADAQPDEDDPWLRGGGVRAREPWCELPWSRRADRCPLPWARDDAPAHAHEVEA